jgi:hypothetical protein
MRRCESGARKRSIGHLCEQAAKGFEFETGGDRKAVFISESYSSKFVMVGRDVLLTGQLIDAAMEPSPSVWVEFMELIV